MESVIESPERPAEGADQRTRDRVARALLEAGPATATALGQRLELTPAAVRRHLEALLEQGEVEVREPAVAGATGRRRGRPARQFALTRAGRARFGQRYDDLATSALRFLAAAAGREAIDRFARDRVADLEVRYRPLVEAAPPAARARVLAEALSADGYAASAARVELAGGAQLCQHHCPVARVAEEFPELCAAETEVISRLLGTHVQRLATIAHGDGVCTTFVPSASSTRAPEPPTPERTPA